MHPFAYEAPGTIDEAVAVLDKHGDRARPIAGGTDVLVQARANRWDLDAIVDVKNIPELTQISHYPDGSVSIGAAVPCYQIYEDQKIRDTFPGIIDAVEMIGGIQIQIPSGVGRQPLQLLAERGRHLPVDRIQRYLPHRRTGR